MNETAWQPGRPILRAAAIPFGAVLLGMICGYLFFRNPGQRALTSPAPTPVISSMRCVALGPKEEVYVGGTFGIRLLDRQGQTVRQWPTEEPVNALAVDAAGNFYVAYQTLVEKISPDGESVVKWGRGGCDGDPFTIVTGIALSDHDVFVADAGSKTVYRFTKDGEYLNAITGKDPNDEGLGFLILNPHFDCVVRHNVLFVNNPGLFRVERYDFEGNLLGRCWEGGMLQKEFPGCCNPTNVTITKGGLLVVAQKGDPCVKVFDPSGKRIAVLGEKEFGESARGIDLVSSERNQIYAVDPVADCLRTFTLPEESSDAAGKEVQ